MEIEIITQTTAMAQAAQRNPARFRAPKGLAGGWEGEPGGDFADISPYSKAERDGFGQSETPPI
jgi:hypothetical protein